MTTEEGATTNYWSFSCLQAILHRHIEPLLDHRNKGENTRDRDVSMPLGASSGIVPPRSAISFLEVRSVDDKKPKAKRTPTYAVGRCADFL